MQPGVVRVFMAAFRLGSPPFVCCVCMFHRRRESLEKAALRSSAQIKPPDRAPDRNWGRHRAREGVFLIIARTFLFLLL